MRKKSKKDNSRENNIILNEIDYEKLANVIMDADKRIKEKEIMEQREKEKYEEERWKTIIHHKECPNPRNIFISIFFNVRNDIVMILSTLFFEKRHAIDARVTVNFIKMLLCSFFDIFKYFFYFVVVIFVVQGFNRGFDAILVALIFFALLLGKIFQIMRFEIENMRDQTMMLGIFSALTSFVALLIAIVALFVS